MYNFVTKPQLLPISKTTNVHHFYEFQGKQLHQKQLQERHKLDQLLSKIQHQEQKPKPNKSEPAQPTNKQTHLLQHNKQSHLPQHNKSYFIDFQTSNHSSKNNQKPNSIRSFNDFYEKNKKWKQNIQAEILKKKQQKIRQQQQELSECRKPFSEQSSKLEQLANQSKNSNSIPHSLEYKGPISDWTKRFHDYVNKRLPQYPQVEFKPTINKKSQIIAGRMVGKVEDRLIKFGQILKMRKHETIIEEAGKIGKLPGSEQSHYQSTYTNKSDLFFRLFKEGQKTNRQAKQHSQRKEFSFKPSISKLPQNLEKKVKQKRQKSPLYTSKKFTKQQTHRLLELYTKETGKAYSEVEFQNFMKRNQLLLEKRNKQLQQKVKQDMIKEEKEFQECTFIPLLNPRSVRMFSKVEDDNSFNEHMEYEYSHDELPLEESPSQLFTELKPTSKKSTHLKPRSKYSYPHSYTQSNDNFEYEMNTPSKSQLRQSKISHSRSPRQNEVSEMDSLQFSGQKHRGHSMLSKQARSGDKDENEVINYELTFSNTKLAHQLSEINHIEEEPEEPQFEMSINENQPKSNYISSRSERELSQYIERKECLENGWESELEKVKSRLQALMKGSNVGDNFGYLSK